jgi:general secretion pathway protein G
MPAKDALKRWGLCLLFSLAVAAVVAATAYVCAWCQFRNYHYYRWKQTKTKESLTSIATKIDRHRAETGRLPRSLSDLELGKDRQIKLDDQRLPLDAWNRPIQYQVNNEEYDLFSYGADGESGGSGLDADLHYGDQEDSNQQPTLWQFAYDLDTAGIQATCLLAGAVALPICLLTSLGWDGTRSSAIKVLVAHAITALFALVTASMIAVVHLPSGH